MNIKPYDKTIRELLVSGSQFLIPRFQREYSWDKKNYQEFYEDMINNLLIEKGRIKYDQYFLGTMLFIGNYAEDQDHEIDVVDGQQRLTTITILFSAISDVFRELKEETLSKQVFRYIMTKDDDGEEVRILKSKTHYPFFAYFIQDIKKEFVEEPSTEEELCIKETYDYFREQLEENRVKKLLKKRFGSDTVDQLKYVDVLKALRDQVLYSTFVSISTSDKDQANRIFEILNAKGKKLAHVDLIKNKIFEVLDKTEPADFAEEKWNGIKKELNSINMGMATFYRHFWVSRYKKSYNNKMYDDFNSVIKPKSKERYKQFLEEMNEAAEDYVKIIKPDRKHYENRKEYYPIVQGLNILTNYFNIVQVRIALLALFKLKRNNLISFGDFKFAIQFMEDFHFAYNAIVSGRANRFEGIYASFSMNILKEPSRERSREIIKEKLVEPLSELFPSLEEFKRKFITLTYKKKSGVSNMKTKYALNKINCYYNNTELFDDSGSVEHIISEQEDENAINIGNLILLEQKLNNECDCLDYAEKKSIYGKSSYKWIREFMEQYPEWSIDNVEKRADYMAEFYYEQILKKTVN